MTETYTLPELQAMADGDLNALAAELRGWTLQSVTDPLGSSFLNWVDDNEIGRYSPSSYTPATDRNQSGELLTWAAGQTFGIKSSTLTFGITIDDVTQNIDVFSPSFACASQSGVDFEVPGNDARAETIAFCAAMLAMKGRLSK